jgi:transcriptional regulator with XRE-family HTH domain
VNQRREAREKLGLTQGDAARQAGVSFATWRRWEEDPSTVKASTATACAEVLDREASFRSALAAEQGSFIASWEGSPHLTPRQAYAIAGCLDFWADLSLGEWLKDPESEPLHTVTPFEQLDPRVMMLVGENRAWAELARRRCLAVSEEIKNGLLPFDRDGCFFDELLMALALPYAEASMSDEPDLFSGLPMATASTDDDFVLLDDEWDAVSDGFDDRCRWDEWEIPLFTNHPLLRTILEERHPFTWFDPAMPTGAGYLNRLIGIETLVPSEPTKSGPSRDDER